MKIIPVVRQSSLWLAACLITAATAPIVNARTDILASSGDPGASDILPISHFYPFSRWRPVINDAGQVAFLALLDNTDTLQTGVVQAIFRATVEGGLDLVARSGQRAPNRQVLTKIWNQPILNQAGQVLFFAEKRHVSSSFNTSWALYVRPEDGGTLVQVAREGQTVPSGKGSLSWTPTYWRLNDSGQVSFNTIVDSNNPENAGPAIFISDDGTLSEVVRENLPAPDGHGKFTYLGVHVLNNAGQIAFAGGSHDGKTFREGVFLHDGNTVSTLAREGQPIPNSMGTFGEDPAVIGIGNGGHVAFYAELEGSPNDGNGLFLASNGSVAPIALPGQQAPQSAQPFFSVGGVSKPNSAGQVAFVATHDINSTETGLYMYSEGALTRLAQDGQAVSNANGTLRSVYRFSHPGLIETGQVAFGGSLEGVGAGVFLTDGQELIFTVGKDDPQWQHHTLFSNTGINKFGQFAFIASRNTREHIVLFTPDLHWRRDVSGPWDNNDNWTIGLSPAHVHDIFIDPATDLTVTGPVNDTTIKSLQVGGGTGAASLSLLHTGTIHAVDGVTIARNGMLGGGGTIGADLTVQGVVAPGGPQRMIQVVGDAVFQGSAAVDVSIEGLTPGTQHAQITVAQTATLSGTLDVVLGNGFVPQYGDTFDILLADQIDGNFRDFDGDVFRLDDVNLPDIALVPQIFSNVDGSDTDVVRLTATGMGDANVDGRVTFADLSVLQRNFNDAGDDLDWFDGDFTGDGRVTFADFSLVQLNFGEVFLRFPYPALWRQPISG